MFTIAVRIAVVASALAFLALILNDAPWFEGAECMGPDITGLRLELVQLAWSLTVFHLVTAWLAAPRLHPAIALAFLVEAHASASLGLEGVAFHRSEARAVAVHQYGPWGLMREDAGDGSALLSSWRFRRGAGDDASPCG